MNYLNNLLTLNCLGSGLPPIISSDLNFRVIGGTTQPENPRENDIWIETNTTITSYSFQNFDSTNDLDFIEGKIYIKTDLNTNYIFNAIKINELYVSPVTVYQIESNDGILVCNRKMASIYKNNKWNLLATFWYNRGNFYTINTFNRGTSAQRGSLSIAADKMQVTNTVNKNYSDQYGWIFSNIPIDLTNISTVVWEVEQVSLSPQTSGGFGVCKNNNYAQGAKRYSMTVSPFLVDGATQYVCDVSTLTGNYYLCYLGRPDGPTTGVTYRDSFFIYSIYGY